MPNELTPPVAEIPSLDEIKSWPAIVVAFADEAFVTLRPLPNNLSPGTILDIDCFDEEGKDINLKIDRVYITSFYRPAKRSIVTRTTYECAFADEVTRNSVRHTQQALRDAATAAGAVMQSVPIYGPGRRAEAAEAVFVALVTAAQRTPSSSDPPSSHSPDSQPPLSATS